MKKALSLILALTLMLCLFAGCNPADNTTVSTAPAVDLSGKYEIKVWVAENHVDLTKQLITKFNETNGRGIEIVANVEPVGEGDVATQMINDIEMGADLFTFAQDQTARLILAGALSELGKASQATISEANAAGVVSAATVGGTMFAYPMTADNGYFMYYDKSVIKEEDLGSLEKLIAACEAANRPFSFELENGWYTASFFFGAGCVSEWTTNKEGLYTAVNDDFNSDKGVIAAKGMQKLLQSPMYLNSSQTADFEASVPSAIVVSGTWNYENAKGILGDNLGTAKLPSFEVDGKTYQLGSFNGCKLIGVKPQTDSKKAAVLHLLAQFLTNEESQLARFNALSWGPSNLKAQENEAVKSNPGLAALLAQSPYSVPQGQVHGDWWNIAVAAAVAIKEAPAGDETAIKAALKAYEDAIKPLADVNNQADPNSWGVIGIGGKWDSGDDKPMTKQEDGTWKSNEAFELKAGDSFKVRKGGQWDEQFGANGDPDPSNPQNFVVEADGTYYVVLDVENKTITLVAA